MGYSEETLLREPSNQSASNLQFLREIAQYWEDSPSSVNEKLENFTKYVSREVITKFLARNEVFLKQINVHGSIVELGVARGASLMTWAHLSAIYEPSNYTREIIGFDTFSGFPSIDSQDIGSEGISEHLRVGGFCVEPNMEEDIKESIRIHDLTRYLGHIPKVRLVQGDIETTLPNFIESNPHLIVSLLHLDADLYRPTRLGLELLVPRIPKGGLIVFDEINSRLFPGETIALIDAIGVNPLRIHRVPYCPSLSYAVIE